MTPTLSNHYLRQLLLKAKQPTVAGYFWLAYAAALAALVLL